MEDTNDAIGFTACFMNSCEQWMFSTLVRVSSWLEIMLEKQILRCRALVSSLFRFPLIVCLQKCVSISWICDCVA